MRLGLSTGAAPDWPLDAIVDACAGRGLRAIELVAGHAHGLGTDTPEADAPVVSERLRQRGIELLIRGEEAGPSAATLRLAGRLRATVTLPTDAGEAAIAAAALAADAARVPLLLAHDTDAAAAERASRFAERYGCGLSWRIDPARERLDALAGTLLDTVGDRLRHIHLLGSGPESAASEGRGIGALLAMLALRGWDGVLTLAPSSPDRLPIWRLWLGRAGWGCGSRTGDDALVRLDIPRSRAG